MFPLYFIACPLRRSFAAAIIQEELIVESYWFDKTASRSRSACLRRAASTQASGKPLQQLELRQILRVDDSDRHVLFVHNYEVIDLMPFEEV